MFWKPTDYVIGSRSYHDSDESGSAKRFESRVETFRLRGQPVYKHHIWWLIHNCVAHPLIGVLPVKFAFDFHDYTSKRINAE